MNLDELKPIWKSYKEQTEDRYHWNPVNFEHLLETTRQSIPWYRRPYMILQYASMYLVLIALTGC
jgi:hypothetical protein